MRSAIAFALAIACTACARSEETATSGATAGSSSPSDVVHIGEGGSTMPTSVTAGGVGAEGSAGVVGGSSSTMGGIGGMAASGGAGGSGGAPVDDADPMPGARSMDALIPEPRETCPELVTGTVTVLGMSVEVLAGTPGSTPGPLVIAWHGNLTDGTNALHILPSGMKDEIVAMGGMIVAPNSNGETREGVDTGFSYEVWFTSDYELADELVACAFKHNNIDPRRIYTTGCSAGGLMAGAFTLERSSYVAAGYIGNGGLFMADAFKLQDPTRVPSVFGEWGSDELIPLSFEQTFGFLADAVTSAGGFAAACPYSSGYCNVPEEHEQDAWEFLKAHPFGVAPFPYAGGMPASFSEKCTIVAAP